MLRKFLFSVCTSLCLAVPASADDAFNWTGFHAGINAGYGSGQYDYPMEGNFTTATSTYALNGSMNMNAGGIVGGGQAGYDHLFANALLIGFETDFGGADLTGNVQGSGPLDTGTLAFSAHASTDFLGTARARIGYVLPQNILIYGTAGLAYGGISGKGELHLQRGVDTLNIAFDRFAVDVGWTVGAGIECPVSDHLSLRAEYLYADLGTNTVLSGTFLLPPINGTGSIQSQTTAHIVRIALNYAFN